jgi:uncharacterized protein
MQGVRILKRLFSISLLAGFVFLLNVGNASAYSQAKIQQSESNVTYPGVNGVTLAGTLLIPTHWQGERVPGVVIVAGSGSIDRNGNDIQLGVVSNMYKQLAEDLAQHGIASLRYDKRGVGASTPYPLPKDPQHPTPTELATLQNFAAWDNYVGDAAASLRYLQSQSVINSRSTAMLGHSEGTYISEEVATTRYPGVQKPVALVLAGAPGRTIDVLLREQIDNGLKQLQVGSAIETFVLQQYDAVISGIKQTGQIPIPPLLNLNNNAQVPASVKTTILSVFSLYNTKFWQGELKVVPTELLREYRGPVLLLQGTSDHNVFANEDTPLLDKALEQRPHDDHFTLFAPHASHFLKRVQNDQTDPGITGPVVPEVLFTLPLWLNLKVHLHFPGSNGLLSAG